MNRAVEIAGEVQPLGGARRAAALAGVVGAAGVVVAALVGARDGWGVFFRSYLLNCTYVLSLGLGGLFFVMLQHLTRAGWSVSIRRLAEFIVGTLPVLALLSVPLLVPAWRGWEEPWPWANPAAVAGDPLLQGKAAYLNVPFWTIRLAIYFGIWALLARFFLRTSLAQDESGDPQLTLRMQWWSAPGMLLFALTVTFFAIDVLMSLNPHWYSTIFGVYFFSGCLVGFFALLAVVVWSVHGRGALRHAVTIEHYHDIGKLAFGFVVFWAYIAFSQYMLIWYANLPEETIWYQPRQDDPWWAGVSLLLLGGHFTAPFLALLSRLPKRRPSLLTAAAVWLLAMHWLDLYYLVMPTAHGDAEHAAPLHATDLLLLVGLGGLFAAALLRQMARHTLLPARDPRLLEALRFENI
ncbi:MAG: quinol:cytochrome C oxidoreductase [Planctomycetota bacterium]